MFSPSHGHTEAGKEVKGEKIMLNFFFCAVN
jgi:hypothetical protein